MPDSQIFPTIPVRSSDDRVGNINEYYGLTLSTKDDLATNVCTCDEPPTKEVADILAKLHPDVVSRFYGCGSPFPPLLAGKTVLDLGCGGGRDCFVLSQLVGPEGHVIGVDATEEQIEFARGFRDYHAQVFGYDQTNVEFLLGKIEDLDKLGIPEHSVDVIVSNCVINLSEAKDTVLKAMKKLLVPGGEVFFADIYSDRRLGDDLKHDPFLINECIGDVQYFPDFIETANASGFRDVRVVSAAPKAVGNEVVEKRLRGAQLSSRTVRMFNLSLDAGQEDYGQVAIYLGGIPEQEDVFVLDEEHVFEQGRAIPVSRNTARMLAMSRYNSVFSIIGDAQRHFGAFHDSAQESAEPAAKPAAPSTGCC